MPKIEGCAALLNYKNNIFLNVPMTQLNEAYPGLLHECPYKVNTFDSISFLLKFFLLASRDLMCPI